MQDLTTYRYQFIITPLDIVSQSNQLNASLSPHQFKQSTCTVTNSYALNHHIKNKSVVIKLGQSLARSNGLNIPMRLETEVLYSKSKNKFSSSKGIIKIYDVFIDDNEVISCVGTFQAEGILEMGAGKHIITKNIGATLIKFQVQAIQVNINQQKNQQSPHFKFLQEKPYKVQRIILDENSQIQSKISIEDSQLHLEKSQSENFHNNPTIDFTQMRPLQIQSRQIIITQVPPTLATNLQMSLDLQEDELSRSLSNTISNVKTIQIDSPQKQGDKFYFENEEKKKKVEGSNLRGFNTMSHDLVCQKFQPNDFIDLKSAINFGNSVHTNSGISITGSKLSAKVHNLKKFNQQSSSTINRNYHKNININLNSETYSQPPSYKNPNSPQSPFSPYTPLSFHSPTNKKQRFDFQIALPKISKLSSIQNVDKQLTEENQVLGDDVVLELESNKSKRGSQQCFSAQFQKVNLNFKNMITQSIDLQNSNGKSDPNKQEKIVIQKKNLQFNKDLSKNQVIQKPLSSPGPFTKNSSQICLIQNQIPDLSMSVASNATSVISNPQLFNQYQRKQLETLGQLLIEQRHKNIEYEERIQKLHLKTVTLKQKYLDLIQQWQQWRMYSNRFIDNLHKDELGCYILQLSKNNEKLSLKYNTTEESQNDFINFLRLTIKNSSSKNVTPQACKSNDKKLKTLRTQMSYEFNTNYSEGFKERLSTEYENMENGRSQFDKVIQKIEETYATNNKLKKQNKQLLTKMEALSIKIQRLENTIVQNRQKQSKLSEQNHELKREKQYLETQINSLTGINHYLKEKDEQMESIISLRENTIQNMKRVLEKNNEEMDLLEEEYMGFKKKYENKDLILEEMKEQLADKDDLIQVYKELYGEVNRYYKIRDQYLIEQQVPHEQIDEINMKESKMNSKNCQKIDSIKSQDEKKLRKSQKNSKEQEVKQRILNVPFINSIENISQLNKVNSYSVNSSYDERDRERKTSLQESAIREQVKNIEKLKSNQKENKQFYETMQINKNKQLLASIITGNERIDKLKQDDIRVIRKQITKVINKIEIQAKIISGSGDLFLSLT